MNFLIRLMCLACLLAMVNLSLHATVHTDHALGDSAALVDCQCCQTYDSLADHGALNFKPLATARASLPRPCGQQSSPSPSPSILRASPPCLIDRLVIRYFTV